MPTIEYNRVVHLSHEIDEQIPLWPGDPPVECATVAYWEMDGYFLRRLTIGEHSGTHFNAQRSFYKQGVSASDYPAHSLLLPAVIIDRREQADQDADYRLFADDLLRWEAQYGQIAAGSLVVLFTGWQQRWHHPQSFFNHREDGMHFPGFHPETARFLLNERQVAGLGIDTHGVDGGQDEGFTVNRLVLAKSGIVLENLTNLDHLPPTGATLIIGILRLRDGSGSPAAVMGLVP